MGLGFIKDRDIYLVKLDNKLLLGEIRMLPSIEGYGFIPASNLGFGYDVINDIADYMEKLDREFILSRTTDNLVLNINEGDFSEDMQT